MRTRLPKSAGSFTNRSARWLAGCKLLVDTRLDLTSASIQVSSVLSNCSDLSYGVDDQLKDYQRIYLYPQLIRGHTTQLTVLSSTLQASSLVLKFTSLSSLYFLSVRQIARVRWALTAPNTLPDPPDEHTTMHLPDYSPWRTGGAGVRRQP